MQRKTGRRPRHNEHRLEIRLTAPEQRLLDALRAADGNETYAVIVRRLLRDEAARRGISPPQEGSEQ